MKWYMIVQSLRGVTRIENKCITVSKADHFSKEFPVFETNFDISPIVTCFVFFNLLKTLLAMNLEKTEFYSRNTWSNFWFFSDCNDTNH